MVRGVGAAIAGVMFAGMREAETPARGEASDRRFDAEWGQEEFPIVELVLGDKYPIRLEVTMEYFEDLLNRRVKTWCN